MIFCVLFVCMRQILTVKDFKRYKDKEIEKSYGSIISYKYK